VQGRADVSALFLCAKIEIIEKAGSSWNLRSAERTASFPRYFFIDRIALPK
jgi:hypothetical protein